MADENSKDLPAVEDPMDKTRATSNNSEDNHESEAAIKSTSTVVEGEECDWDGTPLTAQRDYVGGSSIAMQEVASDGYGSSYRLYTFSYATEFQGIHTDTDADTKKRKNRAVIGLCVRSVLLLLFIGAIVSANLYLRSPSIFGAACGSKGADTKLCMAVLVAPVVFLTYFIAYVTTLNKMSGILLNFSCIYSSLIDNPHAWTVVPSAFFLTPFSSSFQSVKEIIQNEHEETKSKSNVFKAQLICAGLITFVSAVATIVLSVLLDQNIADQSNVTMFVIAQSVLLGVTLITVAVETIVVAQKLMKQEITEDEPQTIFRHVNNFTGNREPGSSQFPIIQ